MSPEDRKAALLRLGQNRDAQVLVQVLVAELQRVLGPGSSDGAVRHLEGRRSFAAELISKLGFKGTTIDGGTDTAGSDGTRPRGGIARRVPARDPGDAER